MRTHNLVCVEAPLDLVWDMTNDVASWPSLFSEYESVNLLKRDGATVLFRLTTVPGQDGVRQSWVSERTADRDRLQVKAHRVETGPFAYMNIEWRYRQTDHGVEMAWVQDFDMSAESPWTAEQMAEHINTNSKIQMDIIKRRVEERARV